VAAVRQRETGASLAGLACAALLAALPLGRLSPQAGATDFQLTPDRALVGTTGEYVTRHEDTLHDVARTNDLGYGELIAVNEGIDPWLPGTGQRILLPTVYLVPMSPRPGIVINLAEQRLYYFPPRTDTVRTYPIGVGVEGHTTPIGVTRVVRKDVKPTWYPPPSIRSERPELPAAVPPGPDNPMGEYALRLGWAAYGIHGTNKAYAIGRHVTHGCIRLYPEDIEALFKDVAIGTPVRVINDEIRLAWVDNELYLAVTPSRRQMEEIGINQKVTREIPSKLVERVAAAAGTEAGRIDWDLVRRIGVKRPGMPLKITKPSPPHATTAEAASPAPRQIPTAPRGPWSPATTKATR
jgi:L,D-transpeptidase ErfK/SrfK